MRSANSELPSPRCVWSRVPQPVPIPPDVWRRFAALDAICNARIEWHDIAPKGRFVSGRNYARMWVVEIWRRDDGEKSTIIAEGASLAGTLQTALRSAERKFIG
jgi:hypothetical protein